jgi:hypothetical protein
VPRDPAFFAVSEQPFTQGRLSFVTPRFTNMSQFQIEKSTNHTMFVPAFVDDYGFTPEEFRVFSRIMRRSLGSEKDCFEAVPAMAKSLDISERLVRRALLVLKDCGAIVVKERPGKTSVIDFMPCSLWKPASQLSEIRKKRESEIKEYDRKRKNRPLRGTPCGNDRGTPCGNARRRYIP